MSLFYVNKSYDIITCKNATVPIKSPSSTNPSSTILYLKQEYISSHTLCIHVYL